MAKNINGSLIHIGRTEQIGQQIIQNYGPSQAELEKLRNDLAEQLLGDLPVEISQKTQAIVGKIVHDEITAVLLRIDEKAESEEDLRESVSRNFEDLHKFVSGNFEDLRESVSRNFEDLREDIQAVKEDLKKLCDAPDDDDDDPKNLERLSRDAARQADEAFGKIIKVLSEMRDIAQEFKEAIRLDYTYERSKGWKALGKGKFDKAEEFFGMALKQKDNEADAYFGKYLADCKIQVLWDYVNCRWQPIFHDQSADFDDNEFYEAAIEKAQEDRKAEFETFYQEIKDTLQKFDNLVKQGRDYDCFICVKVSDDDKNETEDSKKALDIYQTLLYNYKPFYSQIILPHAKDPYFEAHILYALYKAKCMIVVCSDEKYLKTPWMKNEYTRYIEMMNAGLKEPGSIRIGCVGGNIIPRIAGIKGALENIDLGDFKASSQIVEFVSNFVKKDEKDKYSVGNTPHAPISNGNMFGAVGEQVKSEELPAGYPTLENYNKEEFEVAGTILEKYKGEREEVKIPYGVTSIGSEAFYGCEGLTSVTIPDSVTSIGDDAFDLCKSLTSFIVPGSVTSIGANPFEYCAALESITAEEGNPVYRSEGNCLIEKKTGKLIAGCKTSVIPNGVTSIGDDAFDQCATLTSIAIPDSVTSIGDGAFYGCEGLTSITIPNGVTSIGESAFEDCKGLRSVTISSGVTNIGDWAFSGCEGLTGITVPSGATSIGGYAFNGCEGLKSVTIPKSVTNINGNPFSNCNALESITVEDGNPMYKAEENCLIEKKTGKLIAGCKTSVIPNGVTSIGNCAFWGCTGLTSVTIPKSVTSIEKNPFEQCKELVCITVEEGSSAYKAEGNCLIEKKTGKLIAGCKASVIPNGVTRIGEDAFWGCAGLTSITIPNGVTRVEGWAFSGCTSLQTVYYEGTREQWDKIAISDNNDKLKNATRFYNVAAAQADAIGQEEQAAEATSKKKKAYEMKLIYPDKIAKSEALPADYPTLKAYNKFVFEIEGTILKKCKRKKGKVKIPYGVTSIGEGAFERRYKLKSITIPNSVTTIEKGAFGYCEGLISIEIPDSVTSICENAFQNCTSLESLIISSGVTSMSIGVGAFTGCKKLKEISIPIGVTSIGDFAFSFCGGLTSVTIAPGVTSIGQGAFYCCGGLTSLIIPNSVTSMGKDAFVGCGAIKTATMPAEALFALKIDGLTSEQITHHSNPCENLTEVTITSGDIRNSTFSGCKKLQTVIIDPGVTSIGVLAFERCIALTSITIPVGLTDIGPGAFLGCTNLQTVYYEGTSEQWDKISISDNNDKLKNATRFYNVAAAQADAIGQEEQAAEATSKKKVDVARTSRKEKMPLVTVCAAVAVSMAFAIAVIVMAYTLPHIAFSDYTGGLFVASFALDCLFFFAAMVIIGLKWDEYCFIDSKAIPIALGVITSILVLASIIIFTGYVPEN